MYELGHYERALDEARRLVSITGSSPDGLRILVRDAILQGNLAEAAEWQERLVELVPEQPQSWVELARLQVRLDELASARRTLERAQQQHAEVLEIETARAHLFRREGRAEEAYAAYGALAQKYPERENIFRALVQTASEAGRHVEALELLEDTRVLRPYAVELQRARLLYDLGESSTALDTLARVAQPDGKVFVPVLLYRGLGKHARASAMYVSHFESQMEALREAGYTAVTVKELARMASGDVPLPERPIVITFNDARLQSLLLGVPVLARHGLKASMFVSTSSVPEGHPRFADWQVLRSFAMTRRWDLQSQGQRAHDLVTVTPNGEQGSFLTDHILLPEKPRYETSRPGEKVPILLTEKVWWASSRKM